MFAIRRLRTLLLTTLWCCAAQPGHAAETPSVEYQVKASMVYNFLHFVEWPEGSFRNDTDDLTICLIGEDRYGSALGLLEGEMVRGKTLRVKNHDDVSGSGVPDTCRVVIFGDRHRRVTQRALPAFDGRIALTIGESPAFLEDGGMIRFTIVEDSVKFEINQARAKEVGIDMSSKLLRLAHRVVKAE